MEHSNNKEPRKLTLRELEVIEKIKTVRSLTKEGNLTPQEIAKKVKEPLRFVLTVQQEIEDEEYSRDHS